MGASIWDGPKYSYGNMAQLLASVFGTGSAVPDPNQDAGPDGVFQGVGVLDCRLPFLKDKVQGYTGVVQAALAELRLTSASVIPATVSANIIAAAQNVTSGTAMTLGAAAVGWAPSIPIVPFDGSLNSEDPVTVAALDYGFAFGDFTAADATVVVADSNLFYAGMPICAAGAGASGTALLTVVASITDATHIEMVDAAGTTVSAAPIGTGNLWGPTETSAVFPTPTAAYPFLAGGPGLFLDPRQALMRGIRIVGPGGGSGGAFLVSGYDVYGRAQTETITVASGSNTVYSLKTWKYIASVTPQFTDATNYTVGTADMFGFAYRALLAEKTTVWWAGSLMVSSQGFVAADTTSPATATTNDPRGTIQTGSAGGGTGIGSTATNGTVSSLAMAGRRLEMSQVIAVNDALFATVANPVPLYGVTPA